jgi:hypothetical protein
MICTKFHSNWSPGSGEDFNFCHFPLGQGCPLHLNNLESPPFKNDLCQVWLKLTQWFWRRSQKCKTDDRRSEKLTWAFSSCELKSGMCIHTSGACAQVLSSIQNPPFRKGEGGLHFLLKLLNLHHWISYISGGFRDNFLLLYIDCILKHVVTVQILKRGGGGGGAGHPAKSGPIKK